jgi:hypothetical protein
VRIAVLLALVACQSSEVSRKLGARCDVNADCAQTCLPIPDWPGGFCTTSCDSDANCESDAACIDENGGVCAFGCISDASCTFLGAGYTCQSIDAHPNGGTKVMVCHG